MEALGNHMPSLRITEIFNSLQGESRTVGLPTVFVRLTGCPLRCGYCDSEYAFYGGEKQSMEQVLETVAGFRPKYVCVTGGEPLAQRNCLKLLEALCDKGYEVSLETSGAMRLEGVDGRVSKVMDLKTPGSGEADRNLYENIALLDNNDQLKFVICDRADYEWSRFKIDQYQLTKQVGDIFFSPCHGQVNPTDLAEWILADNLDVRMQMQLHKLLWDDAPGY